MKIITAIEPIVDEHPSVFLGGGITNCPWWQNDVIAALESQHGVLYNPRRVDFPINDPTAGDAQIAWEFEALNRADIFTMWFSNANSDQPICMYELGRHLAIREIKNQLDLVVIGVEPGYRRALDVYKQVSLVNGKILISNTLKNHVKLIKHAISVSARK